MVHRETHDRLINNQLWCRADGWSQAAQPGDQGMQKLWKSMRPHDVTPRQDMELMDATSGILVAIYRKMDAGLGSSICKGTWATKISDIVSSTRYRHWRVSKTPKQAVKSTRIKDAGIAFKGRMHCCNAKS